MDSFIDGFHEEQIFVPSAVVAESQFVSCASLLSQVFIGHRWKLEGRVVAYDEQPREITKRSVFATKVERQSGIGYSHRS